MATYSIPGLIDMTQSSFFIYIMPWLLVFAIVYGILGAAGIPKNKSARTVISLAIAFFVLPVAGPLVAIIGQLGLGMVMLFTAILFVLILFEVTGTKKHLEQGGKETEVHTYYYKLFGFVLAVLAIMVFIGAGGLAYLGFSNISINYPLVFFIGIIAITIWWMITEGK